MKERSRDQTETREKDQIEIRETEIRGIRQRDHTRKERSHMEIKGRVQTKQGQIEKEIRERDHTEIRQ